MDSFLLALSNLSSGWVILSAFAGVLWGIFGGALPGISPSIAMALLLPFTVGMEATNALVLLASVYVGAEYGGSIPAILIRTPGTNSASATVIDGNEMAKRGQAGSPPPSVRVAPTKSAARIEKLEPASETPDTKEDADNDPRQSLRRARRAEADADRVLQEVKATNVSIEDYRKANAVYVASRNNRNKAEQDFRAWQRDEGITLFVDEAKELFVRPLSVLKQALDSAPKMLGLRCNSQSPKIAEEALTEWIDSVILPKMREALGE